MWPWSSTTGSSNVQDGSRNDATSAWLLGGAQRRDGCWWFSLLMLHEISLKEKEGDGGLGAGEGKDGGKKKKSRHRAHDTIFFILNFFD